MAEIGAALVNHRGQTPSPEAGMHLPGAPEQGACRADRGMARQRASGVSYGVIPLGDERPTH